MFFFSESSACKMGVQEVPGWISKCLECDIVLCKVCYEQGGSVWGAHSSSRYKKCGSYIFMTK